MPQDELVPPPDACSAPPSFSQPRFVLFTLVFLIMIGSVLFALWVDLPYGIQLASLVGYTGAVILYTFSANWRGNLQRYLFRCPFVRPQLPRLALRHIGFLAVLFVLQTGAFRLRPRLSPSWFVATGWKGTTRFELTLQILCAALALTEIKVNRSLLSRAHLEYTPPTDPFGPSRSDASY
jgi:hypothetical protein